MATKKKSTSSKEGKGSGKQVELASLDTLQHFTYDGEEWVKRRICGGGIVCLSAAGNRLRTMDPDTLVAPK